MTDDPLCACGHVESEHGRLERSAIPPDTSTKQVYKRACKRYLLDPDESKTQRLSMCPCKWFVLKGDV